MSDVADMLGLPKSQSTIKLNPAEILHSSAPDKAAMRNKKKPKGMKREVFDLLGPDGLLPAAQVPGTSSGFKSKRVTGLKGKWVYDSINSSVRQDGCTSFRHWVKADITFMDYPYAKFNVRLERLTFTDEEYARALEDPQWTRQDTDALLDACVDYDLRWPVIYDRMTFSTPKPIEDLMGRYYFVMQRIKQLRSSTLGRPSDEAILFDTEKEKKRRLQQDQLFKRTKEDEVEEIRVKEELKVIEAMLKKNKKAVKSSSATGGTSGAPSAAASIAPISIGPTPTLAAGAASGSSALNAAELHSYQAVLADSKGILRATVTNPIQETYTGPQPGLPCLQSARLYISSGNVGLSKGVVGKMNAYLKELGMPDRPLATRAVCDLVDAIRKDTATLVSMSSLIAKKEKDLGTAKSNSGKSSAKNTTKTVKPKPPKKPAAAVAAVAAAATAAGSNVGSTLATDTLPGSTTEGVHVKAEPSTHPLDENADNAMLGMLDAFDSSTMPPDLEAKPTKAPAKKRVRASKKEAAAEQKLDLDPGMAVFDDIIGLDFELPAVKKSKS